MAACMEREKQVIFQISVPRWSGSLYLVPILPFCAPMIFSARDHIAFSAIYDEPSLKSAYVIFYQMHCESPFELQPLQENKIIGGSESMNCHRKGWEC